MSNKTLSYIADCTLIAGGLTIFFSGVPVVPLLASVIMFAIGGANLFVKAAFPDD